MDTLIKKYGLRNKILNRNRTIYNTKNRKMSDEELINKIKEFFNFLFLGTEEKNKNLDRRDTPKRPKNGQKGASLLSKVREEKRKCRLFRVKINEIVKSIESLKKRNTEIWKIALLLKE